MPVIGAHRDDQTVSKIKVTCTSKGATGTAAKGETTDGGATILAPVKWTFKGPINDVLELLQQDCDVTGELAGRPLPHKKYKVAGVKGNLTRLTKK